MDSLRQVEQNNWPDLINSSQRRRSLYRQRGAGANK